MINGSVGKSNITQSIHNLIHRIQGPKPTTDSIYGQATDYFAQCKQKEQELTLLLAEVEKAQRLAQKNPEKTRLLEKKQASLEAFKAAQEKQRHQRYHDIMTLCHDILDLCEGKTIAETRQNTARVLGTIQLLSPTEGNQIAHSNQRAKHLYKAILCLRLLDELVAQQWLTSDYVLKRYAARSPALDETPGQNSIFRDEVQIPLLIAAILQDIGAFHPDAQKILKGEDGKQDEFRPLEKEDRTALLRISYQQSLHYAVHGIGCGVYAGDSRSARAAYQKSETEKLKFIRCLLKSAVSVGNELGNLLKVPQVYCSVVLSTKPNYNYESLPKVVLVMEKGAEIGSHDKTVSDALLNITGTFPQGYGISYVPVGGEGESLDRYEYAIVTGLYPEQKSEPTCRLATRHLNYSAFNINYVISRENNLYYSNARKKLDRVSEERLQEILSKLWSNPEEREKVELLPKYWRPEEYFSYTKLQNLWNKSDTRRN